jgi:oxygen-dependent protoporphyrinogen oxidase
VVVIGGGISGLAAALRLHGRAVSSTVLCEADARLGGKILTERLDGFIIEGGPDSFLSSKPRGIGLARELGLEEHLQGVRADTRRTYIMRDGKLAVLPEGMSGLVPARLGPLFRSPLLSPWGKARAALERHLPPRRTHEDESFGSFMRRRLGREAYERLIEPLMSGIYGGNGDDLSLGATFPQLREMERAHGSLLKGLRATSVPGKAPVISPFVAPRDGMTELVSAIERRLEEVEVRLATAVGRLERTGPQYLVQTHDDTLVADAVILATPAYVSADIVESCDEDLAALLRRIPYAPSVVVSLAYRERDLSGPLDGHGYIIPRREGRRVLACTWTSNKFAHRAPDGWVLMRAFVSRPDQVSLLDREDTVLIEIVRAELQATAGIVAEPALARVTRWPAAMPQYTIGHLERLTAMDRRLAALPGLFLAGAAYRGVGIPDCIQSGEAAAGRAADFIAARR